MGFVVYLWPALKSGADGFRFSVVIRHFHGYNGFLIDVSSPKLMKALENIDYRAGQGGNNANLTMVVDELSPTHSSMQLFILDHSVPVYKGTKQENAKRKERARVIVKKKIWSLRKRLERWTSAWLPDCGVDCTNNIDRKIIFIVMACWRQFLGLNSVEHRRGKISG